MQNVRVRAMVPADDPGWASYGQTILRVHAHRHFDIDLSRPVTSASRAALLQGGLDGAFGVLTPCNPFGHRSTPAENATRLVQFLADLDSSGKRYIRVDGLAPDGSHSEAGVALACSQADVVALARKWRQSAIYWWDGDAMWVIGALTASAPWRLGGPA